MHPHALCVMKPSTHKLLRAEAPLIHTNSLHTALILSAHVTAFTLHIRQSVWGVSMLHVASYRYTEGNELGALSVHAKDSLMGIDVTTLLQFKHQPAFQKLKSLVTRLDVWVYAYKLASSPGSPIFSTFMRKRRRLGSNLT